MDNDKSSELRAYGQTHGDLEKVRLNQVHGRVKKIRANNLHTINDKLFAGDYKDYMIAEHDRMHYHIAMEMREFDKTSGERLSKPFVNVMDVATFNQMKNAKPHDGFFGKAIAILHDPSKDFKSAPGGRFEDLKASKEFYNQITGEVAGKFWDMKKTIEEIETFEKSQQQAADDAEKAKGQASNPVIDPTKMGEAGNSAANGAEPDHGNAHDDEAHKVV